MTFLPSLPGQAVYRELVGRFPDPLCELDPFTRRLLYGPSAFDLGERELMAAYVSALNECDYCTLSHRPAAEAHGVVPDRLTVVEKGLEALRGDDALRPVFQLIRQVVQGRAGSAEFVNAVLEAGWSEEAVIQAVAIAGYWTMINQIVDALGIAGDDAYYARMGPQLAREGREIAASFEQD